MATLNWAGTTSSNPATASNWIDQATGLASASIPTAADNVRFGTGTGATNNACTVATSGSIVARSIDFTGYTGTFTSTSGASNLTIGDATAGTGNIALKLVAGMTWTVSNHIINFVSTSATQQTITLAGKSVVSLVFNGVGGSWIHSDAVAAVATGILTVTNGTWNSGNFNHVLGGFGTALAGTATITPGSSSITLATTGTAFDATSTGRTFTANTATWTATGGGNFGPNTAPLAINFNGSNVVITGSAGQIRNFTAANITLTGSAAKTHSFPVGGDVTATGTFTVNGNSAVNRPLVASSVRGTPRTITAATFVATNVADFMDITFAGAATWTVAGSGATALGDAGGNTGMTFSTPVTQTATGTASFTWSTHTWTTRVPLPQDDVIVNNAFIAGRTITLDMPRMGKSVDMSGATGSPTYAPSGAVELYGDFKLPSGSVQSGSQSTTLAGRGSFSVLTNSLQFLGVFAVNTPTGTYTLLDDWYSNRTTVGGLTMTLGTFDTGNFKMNFLNAASGLTMTGGTLNMGTNNWEFATTTATTFWNVTGGTIVPSTSNIILTTASANTRTFVGGGKTYNKLTYTTSGSTGQLTITGSNTWNTGIFFSDGSATRTLAFTSATTQTLGPNANLNGIFGTAGNLMTVKSLTAASAVIFSKPYGGPITTTMDYVSLQDVTSTQPLSFFAGANSTSVSGNSIIYFSTPGTYRFKQSVAAGLTGTSIGATLLDTPTAGNLLIAYYDSVSTTGGLTPPAGWTQAVTTSIGVVPYIFYKVADGTESTVTFSQVTSRPLSLYVEEISGFTGTPVLDVTDSNTAAGSSTSISTTATTGPTNTAQPALAVAFMMNQNTVNAPSASNSFVVDLAPRNTALNWIMAVKELTTLAAVDTTISWTTSRANSGALLAVFKNTASTVQTQTGKARITIVSTQTQTGKSRVTATTLKTQTGKADITATTTRTQTGKARITVATAKTQTGISRITATSVQTQAGKAKITATTSQTQTGKSRITATSSQAQTGVSSINVTTTQTQTGKANLNVSVAKTQTGKSTVAQSLVTCYFGINVPITDTATQTGIARITAVTSRTQTGKARITATNSQTQTGKSRVTNTTSQTQAGVARIAKVVNQTITGVAKISIITTRTQTGKAKILVTVTTPQTITGKANIKVTTQRTQAGKASIAILRNRTQTGVARINYGTDINTLPNFSGVDSLVPAIDIDAAAPKFVGASSEVPRGFVEIDLLELSDGGQSKPLIL